MKKIDSEKLHKMLMSYLSSSGESINSLSKRMGIEQASLNRYARKQQKSLAYDSSLKLLEGIGYSEEDFDGEPVSTDLRIKYLEARLADKDEIIAMQKERIAEQKERISELKTELSAHATIEEKLDSLRKNQELFARVHMLAKLATKDGKALADEIGVSRMDFAEAMCDEEMVKIWSVLGEGLVNISGMPDSADLKNVFLKFLRNKKGDDASDDPQDAAPNSRQVA